MEEREENRRGTGCVITGVVLILLPALYVAGIGPAALIAKVYPATNDWLKMLYFPMLAIAENWPLFGDALEWYFLLWGV